MPFPRPRERVALLGHYWRQHCALGEARLLGSAAAVSLCPSDRLGETVTDTHVLVLLKPRVGAGRPRVCSVGAGEAPGL